MAARRKECGSHLAPFALGLLWFFAPAVSDWGQGHTAGCGRDRAVYNFLTATRLVSPPAPVGRGCSENHVLREDPLTTSPQGSKMPVRLAVT